MKKQLTTIFASLFLAFALTAVAPAQTGCRLNEDGTSKCGNPPPIRPPDPTPAGATTSTASAFSATWIWTMLSWLSKV